jgi:hypothetical protein
MLTINAVACRLRSGPVEGSTSTSTKFDTSLSDMLVRHPRAARRNGEGRHGILSVGAAIAFNMRDQLPV